MQTSYVSAREVSHALDMHGNMQASTSPSMMDRAAKTSGGPTLQWFNIGSDPGLTEEQRKVPGLLSEKAQAPASDSSLGGPLLYNIGSQKSLPEEKTEVPGLPLDHVEASMKAGAFTFVDRKPNQAPSMGTSEYSEEEVDAPMQAEVPIALNTHGSSQGPTNPAMMDSSVESSGGPILHKIESDSSLTEEKRKVPKLSMEGVEEIQQEVLKLSEAQPMIQGATKAQMDRVDAVNRAVANAAKKYGGIWQGHKTNPSMMIPAVNAVVQNGMSGPVNMYGGMQEHQGPKMNPSLYTPLMQTYEGHQGPKMNPWEYRYRGHQQQPIAGYTNIAEKFYEPRDAGSVFAPAGRRRLNAVALLLNIVLPPVYFWGIALILSFKSHYAYPSSTWLAVFLAFLAPIIAGLMSIWSKLHDREPYWYTFAALSLSVAWLTALIIGDMNYWFNMNPYYNISLLNVYPTVDPATTSGQECMDAGRVYFMDKVRVNQRMAYGFKNVDQYCVAPIVNTRDKMNIYDFWAVGINCCSTEDLQTKWRCGEYLNGRARSGLRLMREDQRPFFRLAVQQAEATFGITAPHPLFFHWMQDPVDEMDAYRDAGLWTFMVACVSYSVFNTFAVIAAAVAFTKIGRY